MNIIIIYETKVCNEERQNYTEHYKMLYDLIYMILYMIYDKAERLLEWWAKTPTGSWAQRIGYLLYINILLNSFREPKFPCPCRL